jgi:hypothetical protein
MNNDHEGKTKINATTETRSIATESTEDKKDKGYEESEG